MQIKTSELTGAALDWAVCECAGLFAAYPKVKKNFLKMWQGNSSYYLHPSTDWAQGGPVIEREGIATFRDWERFIIPGERSRFGGVAWGQKPGTVWGAVHGEYYMADPSGNSPTGDNYMEGSTPLIAAMRCYVASKLGDEVEVPDELR